MKSRPAVIVLAAGAGSRFGAAGHKLTQRLGASTVLASTLRPAIADAARHQVASRDVVVVPDVGTPGAQTLGIGYSIAAGVSARPHAAGWLVLPGDMPLVQTSTVNAVAAALDHHPVAYAQYRGRRGHPVGFAAELYSELVMLSGDEGAKRLVARYPAHGVDVDDSGVLLDVDTEADLDKLRVAHAAQGPTATVAR
jgi:molybdenum cofactor cytidylyltransferase